MNESNNSLIIPGAIIVAGLVIAGAIIFSGGGVNLDKEEGDAMMHEEQEEMMEERDDRPRPVTEKDHIRGNVDAEIVIIEYSDTECPFCKRFHETLQQVINEYGPNEVAWVYRHFPIPQLHSKAEQEAVATECAAELGGNDAFWEYTDRIYEITPSNDGLDLALLPDIAEEVGLDRSGFEACLQDQSHLTKVRADRAEAVAVGGRGTPHSLMLFGEDQIISISGAQPFEQVKSAIDTILTQE